MDYRVILRRYEFDRLMLPRAHKRPMIGYPFLSRLLKHCFEIKKTDLYKQFSSLPTAFRTLYAIHEFDGQVGNGGIGQFFFNAPPMMWFEVEDALARIGAREMKERYFEQLTSRFHNSNLNELRKSASASQDLSEFHANFRKFCEEFEDEDEPNSFNSTYYRQDKIKIDRHLRDYLDGRDEELVRICDGEKDLEREWSENRLSQIVSKFELWRKMNCENSLFNKNKYRGYDLAFTPDARKRLSKIKFIRDRRAYWVLRNIVKKIQQGEISASFITYSESPVPQMTILTKRGWFRAGKTSLLYSEDDRGSPHWGINDW